MPLESQQLDFMTRFLGLKSRDAPQVPQSDPLVVWRNAKEAVDDTISDLQQALKGFDDPVLSKISQYGLNGITDGNQVALGKALLEFNAAPQGDRESQGQALATQAQVYKDFLSTDPRVALCENNPFGIAVPLRTKLVGALEQIHDIAAS